MPERSLPARRGPERRLKRSTALATATVLFAGTAALASSMTAANAATTNLLANSGFDGLIHEALAHFDRVIVDSAPIHVVSDTLLILHGIQTVCLVIGANRTPKNSTRRTVQILQKAGAPLAGVVLNLLPLNANNGYYYDYTYREKYAESAS